jgi:COP9 signalosome complex subunit 5
MASLAMLKMVMHARAGGRLEVMGLLQGKVAGDTLVVLDAFPLPVEGTETRVNASATADDYMIAMRDLSPEVGRLENIIGWYHSHPGYGCWLSGIDVGTQKQYQKSNDPFLAVVVDPVRTSSAGKVELGAFRTFPDGYTPEAGAGAGYQSLPRDKIEDFGVHANSYYQLPVEYFKSSLDTTLLELIWRRFWASTLAASPLLAVRGSSRPRPSPPRPPSKATDRTCPRLHRMWGI